MKKLTLALALSLSLSACKYDNTFTGTFNGAAASMSAYSKNISKYCVALNIKAGNESKSSYISAQAVFDENDPLAPKSFNTKGAECGQNLDEYLVGTRNTKVLSISPVTFVEQVDMNFCRMNTYNQYNYKEEISLEIKANATDATTGTFAGTGELDSYTDRDHPTYVGPIYYCGPVNPPHGPYPHGPYPRDNVGAAINVVGAAIDIGLIIGGHHHHR